MSGDIQKHITSLIQQGTAEEITVFLRDQTKEQPGSFIYKQIQRILEAVLIPLVWLRDEKSAPLDFDLILTKLKFETFIALSRDNTLSEEKRLTALAYLKDLPGYEPQNYLDDGKLKQGAKDDLVPRQAHGFLNLIINRAVKELRSS